MRIAVEFDGGRKGVADLVHDLRSEAELTQSSLARRLDTKQSVVSRWESGADEPRISTLHRIADACGHKLIISAEPHGVDRSQIRELRSLVPRRRLELLASDAAGLDRLLRAAGR